jgi:hypothetical protein
VRDRPFIHKPDPVQTSLHHLKQAHKEHQRAFGRLKSSMLSPTVPIYDPDFPDDAVNGQIALQGGEPFYYWDGAWHPFGALTWAAASYYGTIDSGSVVQVEYTDFITTSEDTFSMTDGKLHTLRNGTYAFFQTAHIYPSGSPALTNEVVITPSLTADSYGSYPGSFYWPDFGLFKVTGYSTGSKSWSPHVLMFRTYNDYNISFPTDQYLSLSIPFATSNCIVSTLAARISSPIPLP